MTVYFRNGNYQLVSVTGAGTVPVYGARFYVEKTTPQVGSQVHVFDNGVEIASLVTDVNGYADWETPIMPTGNVTYLVYTPTITHGSTGSSDIDAPTIITPDMGVKNVTTNWYAKPYLVAQNGISANLSVPGTITIYVGDLIASIGGDLTRVWFWKQGDFAGADIGTGVNLAAALADMSGLVFDCDDYTIGNVPVSLSVGNPAWANPSTWEASTSVLISDSNDWCGGG